MSSWRELITQSGKIFLIWQLVSLYCIKNKIGRSFHLGKVSNKHKVLSKTLLPSLPTEPPMGLQKGLRFVLYTYGKKFRLQQGQVTCLQSKERSHDWFLSSVCPCLCGPAQEALIFTSAFYLGKKKKGKEGGRVKGNKKNPPKAELVPTRRSRVFLVFVYFSCPLALTEDNDPICFCFLSPLFTHKSHFTKVIFYKREFKRLFSIHVMEFPNDGVLWNLLLPELSIISQWDLKCRNNGCASSFPSGEKGVGMGRCCPLHPI